MSRRGSILWVTAFSAALVAAPALSAWPPRLIWNASASAPVGLYAMHAVRRIEAGDLVAVRPPDGLAAFLADRGYLPVGVPLIKRVLALAGAEVCRKGAMIIAYDHSYGEALDRDRLGRHLPRWQGCRRIAEGEVFLMNWDTPDSLDGRYFGPLPVTAITAKLSPLWTDEDGDGRFEWRAGAP